MMKKITKHYKKCRIRFIVCTLLTMIASALFLPGYMKIESTGNNIFTVLLNGTEVGIVENEEMADIYLRKARREIAQNQDGLVLLETNIALKGDEVLFGKIDSEDTVVENMKQILAANEKETLHRSYTLKINEFTVNLKSSNEVLSLLQASIDKYDTEQLYQVELVMDPTRELNVLTTEIKSTEQKQEEEEKERCTLPEAGLEAELSAMFEAVEPAVEKDFADFDLGLKSLRFGDTIEVVEAYLYESELTPIKEAIELVTKDQEKNKIYEVMPGDTLSGIALTNDLTIDKLVTMNAGLESADSMIRAGDELIVTVPEPELSVERTEELYYEEDYEAEIQYVPNDNWYTTEQVTLQEPSAGHRNVVVDVGFRNNAEITREIIKEEITYEAIPKIVERGTKIPPTYIKPISGGRLSSSYGGRKAPTKGASTNHKGVDWAVPTGTAVSAASAGVVTKAGWGSGYGYVVYIRHGDGRETRYGHLSKVLVKAGQTVSQGQKIALSGNTGRSTGPHLHFEIIIGGKSVNPLNYLN